MAEDRVSSSEAERELEHFMGGLVKRNPGEPEFHQAVREIAETVLPYQLAPGKASNAGGVAVSGLEQSQNALRILAGFRKVAEAMLAYGAV